MPNGNSFQFDVVVIGSGFGGAASALRLAEAGLKVLILERGKRWNYTEYPSLSRQEWLWDERNPETRHGWFDVRRFDSIMTIAGAGVGGGSLHYANVSINATPELFDEGWPQEINLPELEPYYKKVGEMLGVKKIPENQFSNRTKLMKEAAQKTGYLSRYKELDLAIKFKDDYSYDASKKPDPDESVWTENAEGIQQGHCVHLGLCNLGCPVEARNTLAMNYIPRAENKHHAEVRSLHIVRAIEPIQRGYKVLYDRIDKGFLHPGSLTARIVIVAAGSIGSTELLLQCRDKYKTLPKISKMLGHKWSTNANYLSFGLHPGRDIFPTRGPTISSAIRFLGDENYKGSHFFIEDGGFPDVLGDYTDRMKNPDRQAKDFEATLRLLGVEIDLDSKQAPLHDWMLWFAQGRDAPTGTFSLRREFFGLFGPKRFYLSWNKESARKVLDAIQEMHRILAKATGCNLPIQQRDALITPHPLGGCPIGKSSKDGVVNHAGEVFNYKNLYVVDGSIIPKPIGHNPSKTIAALSERIAKIIVDPNP